MERFAFENSSATRGAACDGWEGEMQDWETDFRGSSFVLHFLDPSNWIRRSKESIWREERRMEC